jgi:hypothetical protein
MCGNELGRIAVELIRLSVIAGPGLTWLDPAIHLTKKMDPQVKPAGRLSRI